MSENIYFIYNQKLVIFSKDLKKVLVAKRQGEADYNNIYTFIGGKMETTDESFVESMKREKDEEIGENVVIEIIAKITYNILFRKKNGDSVVIAHIPARYISGDIELSDEYSDYKWVTLSELKEFEPKASNIPAIADWALNRVSAKESKYTKI